MSRPFYLSSDSDDDADTLPYPEPLARNAFLAPGFTPTTFLSSLHNRHQTLEDLRSELRTRSQELSKELLDLVNDNYEQFLGLGSDLRGGDEKVEEVRVGLLGFKREIDALRDQTAARRNEAAEYVAERKAIFKEVRLGKLLLEFDARLEELEKALDITPTARNDQDTQVNGFNSNESESESDDGGPIIPLSRITRRVQQYATIQRLTKRIDAGHPFIASQDTRLNKVRQTLLVDLSTMLKQCKTSNAQVKLFKLLRLYEDIGQQKEALAVLRLSGKT